MTDLTLVELDLDFCRRTIPNFAKAEAERRAADAHRAAHNAQHDTGRRPQPRLPSLVAASMEGETI